FAGLVRNALDGSSYSQLVKRGGYRLLVNASSRDLWAERRSFPMETFEQAVMSRLVEIGPRDLEQEDAEEAGAIAGGLAGGRARIAAIGEELLEGEVREAVKKLRQLEVKELELAERLAEAQQRAAVPREAAWEDLRMESLRSEDGGMRLRTALRRVVDEIR